MTTLTLYTAEICPYAQRTRIVLGEKDVAHRAIEIDIYDKPDWFVAMTPNQRVPVIDHDGFVLCESATINEYLDAVFDGPALRPASERRLALMRNEIRHLDSVFLPQLYKMLFEQDPAAQASLREAVEDQMRFLESRLAELQDGAGPYWLGAEVTLADVAAYPFFERLPAMAHYRGVEIPGACERLRRWVDTMAERPAVAATAHDTEWFIPVYADYARGVGEGLSARAFRSGTAN